MYHLAMDIYDQVLAHFGGSPTKLAEALGEPNRSTVNNWRIRGIPANRAKQIERLTGISVKLIRPDDWHEYWPDARRKATA